MHVIRLHGPWTAEFTGPGPPETQRLHLPRDWTKLAGFARGADVALVRRFHRPTGLDNATRVALVTPGGWPLRAVMINGERREAQEDEGTLRRFDLSNMIRTREAHDLRIEFRMGDDLLSAPYFVALEIVEPAG